MKKKIVLVSPAFPYRGGQALVEAHLFHALTQLGYDCHTLTFTLLYPKVFFPGSSQYDQSGKTFYAHSERIYRIINSINPFTWIQAARRIKSLNPDITLFVWWMPFFGPAYTVIAWLVKKWSKSKIVFLVENYISHENRWFDKISSKVTLDQADAYIGQSEFIRNSIQKIHKKPVYKTTLSVYDCYNLGAFTKETAKALFKIQQPKTVLFFGLIRRYKGLDKLIEAMQYLEDDISLLAAGECYEDIAYYEDLIQKFDVGAKVRLVNQFIPNEEIEPYFKSADIVILPYNSASQSGILMMAYGFNKPVMVNNVGGLSELVVEGKTGFVMPNNDPKTIAQAIVKFYENDQEDYHGNIANLNEKLGYGNLEDIMTTILQK